MNIKKIIKISRPRFWVYIAGTYLVSFSFGITSIYDYSTIFFLFLLYFLFIANFFIYGVNDLFDWETDKKNPKKTSKEYKLEQKDKLQLKILLSISFLISILVILIDFSYTLLLLFLIFLFCSYFYSAKPLRFKEKPFVDSISNVLYIMPGIIGFYQSSGELPSLFIILSAWAWATAMHLFSAIPDIKYDKQAGLNTTAIYFGKRNSLFLTSFLWILSGLFIFFIYPILSLILVIYSLIPLVSYFKKLNLSKVYWFFPYLNAIVGFILFLLAIS